MKTTNNLRLENQEDEISALVNDISEQRHEIGTKNNNQHQGKNWEITHCCLTQKDRTGPEQHGQKHKLWQAWLGRLHTSPKIKNACPYNATKKKEKRKKTNKNKKTFQQPLVGKIKKDQISRLVKSIHAYHGMKNYS